MADEPKGTWIVVQEIQDEYSNTVCVATGPFSSLDKADNWLSSHPENKELFDAHVWFLNTPTPFEGE